jgi:hypothetical protein
VDFIANIIAIMAVAVLFDLAVALEVVQASVANRCDVGQ